MKYVIHAISFVILVVVGFGLSTDVRGEFYKYRDENGVIRFTDNLADVPEDQREQVQGYKSIEDNLTPEQLEQKRKQNTPRNRFPKIHTPSSKPAPSDLDKKKAALKQKRERLKKEQEQLEKERKALESKNKNMMLRGDPVVSTIIDNQLREFEKKAKAYDEKRKALDEETRSIQQQEEAANSEKDQ